MIKKIAWNTFKNTGDINTFVKYHSEAVYSIGATAKKGATIVSQKITCGEKENTSPYGDIKNIESGTFIVTATDNRGLTTTQEIEKGFIEYIKPSIVATGSAPTSVTAMEITLDGMCYAGSFGAVNNDITIYYRYAAVNYPYGDWVALTYKPSYDSFSVTISLTDFDYQLGYNFEARIVDKLNDVTGAEIHLKNVPVFDWGENDFNFNVPVNMKVGHIDYNLYGLCRALTEAFNVPCTAIAGTNYSSVSFSASIVGNCMRCNLSATRNSATPTSLIDNEKVCEVAIKHDGKIQDMLNVSFGNGSTGGLASFYTTEVSQTTETLSFSIYLASTAQANTSFNTFFIIPVTLNLNKFVD